MSALTDEPQYVISRAFKDGKTLTTQQRISSGFAEEPVVLGRVLRRGSKPLTLSEKEFLIHEAKLVAQEKAGAIQIKRPEKTMQTPCEKCGQVARGQGGEYKCPACGLPLVFDPKDLPEVSTPPVAPVPEVVPPQPPAETMVVQETVVVDAPVPPAPEAKEEPKSDSSETSDVSSKSKKKKA